MPIREELPSIRPGKLLCLAYGTNASRRKTEHGFSLIELMIAVAVVGILAAIAYPSYQDYVRKSRRSAAQSVLLEVAQKEQQIFLDIRGYAAAADNAAIQTSPLRVALPSDIGNFYDFSVTVSTPSGAPPEFLAEANPKSGQSADKCGKMSITHLGVKSAAVSSGCW